MAGFAFGVFRGGVFTSVRMAGKGDCAVEENKKAEIQTATA